MTNTPLIESAETSIARINDQMLNGNGLKITECCKGQVWQQEGNHRMEFSRSGEED